MQVRKRNGDLETVDVNKIVKAVERWVADLGEVDPLRVATKTISGLYDGATTAELDKLSIQTAAELIGEEPQYSQLAARLLAAYVDKEVRGQGVASFSQSIRSRPPAGPDRRRDGARSWPGNARKLDDAVDRTGDLRFEYFGLRTVADRYLLRHPESRLVVETPQYWLLRVACGLSQTPGRGDRLLPADVVAGLSAQLTDPVQLRHRAHPDVVLLPGRLAEGRAGLDLRALPPGREAVEVLRRHRHLLVARPRPGRADPRHERQVQRHRPVPQDARRGRGGGQPGRSPQGRGLRLSGAVAPGRRGVPGAARQHRRGLPPHAQPQPGQLDPGRVHAPGRGRRRLVADRPVRRARAARPVRRGVRRRLPRRREEGRQDRQGPRPVRADDAHPGTDRQRVDDVQGPVERAVQPDRRRATPSTCRTCAPRSSRSTPTTRPRCATSARSTWAPT